MKRQSLEARDGDDRVPPGQSLARGFPVLTYGPTPRLAKERWELRVTGLATPRTLDWETLLSLPQTTVRRDFHCVTHWSKLDVGWSGVLTTDLMAAIEVDDDATHVMLASYGGYTTNLALGDFLRDGCLLAHRLEGEAIPDEHGGPLRAVIPHLYGWKSAKWLHELHFMDRDAPGFWERNGYHNRGDPFAEERYG